MKTISKKTSICMFILAILFVSVQRTNAVVIVTASAPVDELGQTWALANIVDNSIYSVGLVFGHLDNTPEWIKFDLGASTTIAEIKLNPWLDKGIDQNPNPLCFPKDFVLQYSNDNNNWTDIPGQTYTNYTCVLTPTSSDQIFRLLSPINARYIRVYTTAYNLDSGGNPWLSLAEFNTTAVITSLESMKSNNFGFICYPNPVSNSLTIKTLFGIESEMTIRDIKGSIVKQNKFNGNQTLDVSNYISGVYFIEVKDQSSNSKKLFIKE